MTESCNLSHGWITKHLSFFIIKSYIHYNLLSKYPWGYSNQWSSTEQYKQIFPTDKKHMWWIPWSPQTIHQSIMLNNKMPNSFLWKNVQFIIFDRNLRDQSNSIANRKCQFVFRWRKEKSDIWDGKVKIFSGMLLFRETAQVLWIVSISS